MVRVRSGAGAAFEVGRVLVVSRTLMAGIRHDFAAAAISSATSSLISVVEYVLLVGYCS